MSTPAPARKVPLAGELNPSELMRACGSKNGRWKPESPEHWQWQLKNGEGIERALAWVKLNSVFRGSPFCVNAAGETLRIEHMAADCGWKLGTAENYCGELADQGRIRVQRGKALYYRADVPESAPETEKGKYSVQSTWPSYLVDFIENLPAAKKATLDKYEAWRKKFFADGMAALRRIDEQVQDNTLLAVGCNKKRLPKRPPAEPRGVQLSLLEEPDFLANSVQSTTMYTPKSGSVPSTKAAPILIAVEPLLNPLREPVGRSVEEPTDRHADSEDYGAKTQALKTLLIDEWGKLFPAEPVTPKLCGRILAALEGAPLELLRSRLRQRRPDAAGMGFALRLAGDVGKRWLEEAPARAKAGTAAESHAAANREETRLMCEETLADPRASDADKELARELLKSAAAGGVS